MKNLITILILLYSFNSFALLDSSQEQGRALPDSTYQDYLNQDNLANEDSELQQYIDENFSLDERSQDGELLANLSAVEICTGYFSAYVKQIPLAWNSDSMRPDRLVYIQYLIDRCVNKMSLVK